LGRSGPTNQLFNLIKYLDRTIFDPYLITLSPEPNNSRRTDFEESGIHLFSLNLSRLDGIFFMRKKINPLINEINPDIIHTQGIRADIISSKLPFENMRKVSTIRNFPQHDYIMRYGFLFGSFMCVLHMRCLKKISICVGVSESVAKNLRQRYHIPAVMAIQNGVDTDCYFPRNDIEKKALREKLGLPPKGRIWISIGRLSVRKNPVFLIRVWKKKFGRQPDNILILVGDGELWDKCKDECGDYENIRLVGRIQNVSEYLQVSDYFFSTATSEGLPNTVLEAMACGLPVLLSDIEPHKEIHNLDNNIGLCYTLGDEADFIKNINLLLQRDINCMSAVTLNLITEKLSATIMSDKYQRLYQNLLAS
jgi:glycosyltransferase involved in cell wall biosynthesis